MATSKEQFNALASAKPANWTNNFRLQPMPRLSELMKGQKLSDAVAAYDNAMEQWRVTAEKSIAERLKG